MATQTINYGTETAITATNINSLANNQAKPLPVVDNSSTKAIDAKVHFEATLGSSGVSATGTIELYLLESTESTTADFSDGIDPTSASDVAASIKNATLLRILNANANSQVVKVIFDLTADVRNELANCPKYWSVLVLNKSGAALAASGHEANYTAIKMDFA
ncbi:MAG: hypothetical protein IT174_10770 [Acidobacteria bacterium]|nr:hypothetical protein [Acidobacteriota bacterium]